MSDPPVEANGCNWVPECSAGSDASGSSLDALMEDWNSRLSEAVNEVAPFPPEVTPLVCSGTSGDEIGIQTT